MTSLEPVRTQSTSHVIINMQPSRSQHERKMQPRKSTDPDLLPAFNIFNGYSATGDMRNHGEPITYLQKIGSLSHSYKSLRYIGDWLYGAVSDITNVTLVEHGDKIDPTITSITEVKELKARLFLTPPIGDRPTGTNAPKNISIFLVEDLARHTIEYLGSRFSVDPFVFREQLEDHAWGGESSDLHSTKKRRQWFNIRNVRLRYHTSNESVGKAAAEVQGFKVKRNLEIDLNKKEYGHRMETASSFISTLTTIWLGEDKRNHGSLVGIVLLDPSISEGTPIWGGRTNWLPLPDVDTWNDTGPPKFVPSGSWYGDIVKMTTTYPWWDSPAAKEKVDTGMVVHPAVYTVCAEWFFVCNYVDVRLSQIEAYLAKQQQPLARASQTDQALKSVSIWQRLLPEWKKMVEETLDEALPAAARLMSDATSSQSNEALDDMAVDFRKIQQTLNLLQSRVDRLQERGTTEMQIAAARESLAESHDLARLSWLATIFIPLTFVSGLFSMTEDIGSMRGTFKTYFAAAVPVAIVSLVVARWGSKFVRWTGNAKDNMRKRIAKWATEGSEVSI